MPKELNQIRCYVLKPVKYKQNHPVSAPALEIKNSQRIEANKIGEENVL